MARAKFIYDAKLDSTMQDYYVGHDHLEPHNDPCYFYQFNDHLKAHNLTYVCDADLTLSMVRTVFTLSGLATS